MVVYPNTVQDYLQQLVRTCHRQLSTRLTQNQTLDALSVSLSLSQPGTFPYKEDIMSTNNMCLVFAVLIFIGCILSFKVSFGFDSSSEMRHGSASVDIIHVLHEMIRQSESSGSGTTGHRLLSRSVPLSARTALRARSAPQDGT